MKHILLVSFTFLFLIGRAQNPSKDGSGDDSVKTIVEVMPEFPGGDDALLNFVKKNVKYPKKARKNKIEGKVLINFIIDKTGKVTEARVLKGIGGGCDEEALRVVNLMPFWKPGTQDGKAVRVYFNLPIHFALR